MTLEPRSIAHDSLGSADRFPVWHARAGNVTNSPFVDGPVERAPEHARVDVAIIGAGLSGLWTAYYLTEAEPQLTIAVLDAHHVGFGASGRNGGWCSGFLPLGLDELTDEFGVESALATYRASFDTLDEIARVIQKESIECDWHRGGTLQSAATVLQAERLQRMVDIQHLLGLTDTDLEWLPPGRVAAHVRLAETHGGVFSPHCATVNPYALVTGLASVLRRRGVHIWEQSKVHSFADGRVVHAHGSAEASLVVQATEGYSPAFRRTRRSLAPIYSLMVATEPLDHGTLAQLGWSGRATVNDGGRMVIYAQLTADNRIAFGGRGAPYHFGSRVKPQFDIDDDTHTRIVDSLVRCFPALQEARITHRWGGPLGVPRDWIPSISLDRSGRQARLGGYVGDGVAATNLFARSLVDTWLRRDTPLVRLPFSGHLSPRWEREPLRFIGINALIRLAESIDEYEAIHERSPRLRTRVFEALL